MPSQTWGNSVGSSSGSTLTIGYSGIEVSGGSARITGAYIQFYSNTGWSDSVNSITAEGTAVDSAVVTSNVALNGGTRTWYPTATWVPISYGSQTSVYFEAKVVGISFFNGDGSTNYYSINITLPARAYELPDPATSLEATWASDSQANLVWVTHYTATNAAKPWTRQTIERTDDNVWENRVWVSGDLSGTASSWTDTGLVPNKRYGYWHRSWNSAGSSSFAGSATPVYTTPAAPTAVSAEKSANGSITVTATNAAPWADAWEFGDSADGVSWTVVSGTNPSTTFTHSSPNSSVSHRYRVRSRTPDGKWSTYSPVSPVVQLLTRPNPPTWWSLFPAYDATSDIVTSFRHNPVDTTPMTAYEMQSRTSANEGTTWSDWATTGYVPSTFSSRTWTGSTWPQNRLVEIQVRSWGADATASEWSSSAGFRTSARPVATVTSPGSGEEIHGKTCTVAWNYTDAEATPQAASQISLYQSGAGGALLGTWDMSGAATSYPVPHSLSDNSGYRATVKVKDGHGMWSYLSEVSFSVVFVPPPAPEVSVSWDSGQGAAILEIVNPTPVGSEPPAVSNTIYRDGVLVATGIPVSTSWTDRLPLPSGSSYTVEAVSALPSTAPATVALPPVDAVQGRFWLNAGSSWEIVASFWGNVRRGQTQGRNRSMDRYSGRELEVETIGEGRVSTLRLSGTLILSEDSPSDFLAIANSGTPVCYRDRYGSWFVSPQPISVEADNDALAGIAVTMSETDYVDPVRGS